MALDHKELEGIERAIYQQCGDIAVAIGRGFERIEERIDAAAARLFSQLANLEGTIDAIRLDVAELLDASHEHDTTDV